MFLVSALIACAGAGGPTASGPTFTDPAVGVVHSTGPEVWYLVPEADASRRFCLDGANVALQVEGQRVRFAGTPGEIPPNVRMACTPFQFLLLEAAP